MNCNYFVGLKLKHRPTITVATFYTYKIMHIRSVEKFFVGLYIHTNLFNYSAMVRYSVTVRSGVVTICALTLRCHSADCN